MSFSAGTHTHTSADPNLSFCVYQHVPTHTRTAVLLSTGHMFNVAVSQGGGEGTSSMCHITCLNESQHPLMEAISNDHAV